MFSSNSNTDCENCGQTVRSNLAVWTGDNTHPCCSGRCRDEYHTRYPESASKWAIALLATVNSTPRPLSLLR